MDDRVANERFTDKNFTEWLIQSKFATKTRDSVIMEASKEWINKGRKDFTDKLVSLQLGEEWTLEDEVRLALQQKVSISLDYLKTLEGYDIEVLIQSMKLKRITASPNASEVETGSSSSANAVKIELGDGIDSKESKPKKYDNLGVKAESDDISLKDLKEILLEILKAVKQTPTEAVETRQPKKEESS